jgi:predicted phage terminase large subunit-like protein
MVPESWESLYQGNPVIKGGNLFKDDYWHWWKILPQLEYKFITADTSQKDGDKNDFHVFQCWGYADKKIYLLDKLRFKAKSHVLRREAKMFYKKHDTKRLNANDPILRKVYIEDKASGIGLIQELKADGLRIQEIPRNKDKIFRANDAVEYVRAGCVFLNGSVSDIGNLTKEAREFPASKHDDDIDTLMSAIEVTFINKNSYNMLKEALMN